MREITQKIQIHIPFHLLRERLLPWVVRERIQPEIAFNYRDWDRFCPDDFTETADCLVAEGLSVTFHAPFMDLRPGAIDPAVRRVTQERLQRVCELIPRFRPRTVVCHASFDERYYGSPTGPWLRHSLETWAAVLKWIEGTGTIIALENVYERNPEPLRLLFEALASKSLCFCFDAGHANAFGEVTVGQWMTELGRWLGEIHLHDNGGDSDEHLPIGEGNFPFATLFDFVATCQPRPILTVECHSEERLGRMIANLRSGRMLEGL